MSHAAVDEIQTRHRANVLGKKITDFSRLFFVFFYPGKVECSLTLEAQNR